MQIDLKMRLAKIADLLENIDCLADIGTDHGYLPVKLIQEKRIKKAIAGDINSAPLNKARLIIAENKLEAFIETRLGSGLSVLEPDEADGIVIAGMGGILISEILADQELVAKSSERLILQPMNNQSYLRHFLEKNNYRITKESLTCEGQRIYHIISVEAGLMTIEHPLEYELGYRFMDSREPLLKELIRRKLAIEIKIRDQTNKKKTVMAREQFIKSSHYIKALKEVLDGNKIK